MKKILFTTMALICLLNVTHAQTSGGPDAYGYTWKDSNDPNGPAYNWIDIVPLADVQEVKLLSDDNTRGPFGIGFPFHFYWYDVSTFWVGSNGYIGFTNGLLASPFKQIPDTSLPQDFIAGMESDLTFADAGNPAKCWYWQNADTLIVSWIGVPFWQDPSINPTSYTGSNTFQIILSNVDSSITFQYMEQTGFTNIGPGDWMSIGIENNSGSIGLQHSHNTYPPINYAIKYYYPSNTTFQVFDAACDYNDNLTTGGIFISKSTVDTFQLKTGIKNTGNVPLNPFNIQSDVKSQSGITVVANATLSDTLQPNQLQTITFGQGFHPTTAGTFRYRTYTLLSGDATPSNNSRTQEIVVVDTTTASQLLSFDNNVSTAAGISWTGGNGGAGVQFIPPYYPCKIDSVRCYIINDPNVVGYSTLIYDDDGVNGDPLTLLDSEFVFPLLFPGWTTVPISNPVTVTSGSVYVAWYMGGAGIVLGTNTAQPISNRTYEILSSTWAIYRNREIEDLMINIYISHSSVGIAENSSSNYVGNAFPNPTRDHVSLKYEFNEPVTKASYQIFDLQGKKLADRVVANKLNSNGTLNLDVKSFSNGLYICKLKLNDYEFSRRISVIK